MSTQSKTLFSPEEYLELERKAEYKSEYYNGEIFAMSGGSRRHDWIATQLSRLIENHLEGSACTTHSANMRVLVQPKMYTYPDYSVTCEEPRYADDKVDTLINPSFLVEILSPSTEMYDRGVKATLYRDLPSLQELLLIAQDSYEIELYRREADGRWSIAKSTGLEASVELRSIGYTLQLRELYRKVIAHQPRGDN